MLSTEVNTFVISRNNPSFSFFLWHQCFRGSRTCQDGVGACMHLGCLITFLLPGTRIPLCAKAAVHSASAGTPQHLRHWQEIPWHVALGQTSQSREQDKLWLYLPQKWSPTQAQTLVGMLVDSFTRNNNSTPVPSPHSARGLWLSSPSAAAAIPSKRSSHPGRRLHTGCSAPTGPQQGGTREGSSDTDDTPPPPSPVRREKGIFGPNGLTDKSYATNPNFSKKSNFRKKERVFGRVLEVWWPWMQWGA